MVLTNSLSVSHHALPRPHPPSPLIRRRTGPCGRPPGAGRHPCQQNPDRLERRGMDLPDPDALVDHSRQGRRRQAHRRSRRRERRPGAVHGVHRRHRQPGHHHLRTGRQQGPAHFRASAALRFYRADRDRLLAADRGDFQRALRQALLHLARQGAGAALCRGLAHPQLLGLPVFLLHHRRGCADLGRGCCHP
ncbi:hypothetical protein PFLmoz3_03892 [Pseudomonas fluorescens]|uniref:Uncharacterized protein n=1 Tax=Pseudomonas fluorescens TaxID=294 RepID=A0A125QI38_PSEFL|nr:hypothetical protein PFLmoz3_03892 [Pseudomonas fluorescens]